MKRKAMPWAFPMVFLLTLCAQGQFTSGKTTSHILQDLRNPKGRVIISAHRGDWRNAPENSLRGIANCIDFGIDIVEIDIRKTKDGVLVLMHDETLDRTTNGSGLVSEHNYDQISGLRLKDGIGTLTAHRIPTMEEALTLSKDRILLYLDKSMHYMPEVIVLLKRLNMFDQVIFMHPITYTEAQFMFAGVLHEVQLIARIEPEVQDVKEFIDGYITKGFRPLAFQLRLASETEGQIAYVDYIRTQGTRVCVSTLWPEYSAGHDDEQAVDQPDLHWGWHYRKGVTVFNTDRPQKMKTYFESINAY